MLDKLLKYYKDAEVFEIGDGFISGDDGFTLATVFDKRFQGFPDGEIENADLKRLIEAESFGCEKDILWVKNGDKRDLIKIKTNRLLMLAHTASEKALGKPRFECEVLVKAIKKTKVSEANYLGFEGSKARFFDFDWKPIFEIEVPNQSEQEVLYNLGRVKKGLRMKKDSPIFSIVAFGGSVHTLQLHWDDFDMYIVNGLKVYEI